jgi:NAD(P)-dependent dehydrogenase (short-subunit alcohol dehydrogenase family)
MTSSNPSKVALVTGGGTGIGRASAMALQAAGFHVVITGRRQEALDETASLAKGKGPDMLAVVADVSQGAAVKSLFAKIQSQFGRLDVLFNNAGIGAPRVPIEELSEEDWRKTVDINLTGSFLCAQAAFALMKSQDPQGGRIINNGSISAYAPRPNTWAYTSTKHAVSGLTKCIALDGRPFKIAASQLDIGNAETAIGERFKFGVPQGNGQVMVEPTIDPKHCGEAVAYMAGLPLDANVLNMTLMATNMPFVGRG